MTCQLVRSAESLCTSGELAGVWLLARVSTDVSCLVFESVEGLVAERALVGSG